MIGDLIINGKDAYTTWGVCMGDGFLDALEDPAPLKEFVENKSRLEHGKRVDIFNPRLDERDLTLQFTIDGSSPADYKAKKKGFYEELYKGRIDIKVPANGDEIYRLTYHRSVGFAMNISRTFSKISVKFNEPNPSNRS